MMRSRLCKACGEFHDIEQWPLACMMIATSRRTQLPHPNIRPDGMDAIRSHADRKMYDSRSAYYDSVKKAGCEIIGNDRSVGKPNLDAFSNVGRDVKDAIDQLKAR